MKNNSEGVTMIAIYHLALGLLLFCAGFVILPTVFGALQRAVSTHEVVGIGSSLIFSVLLTWGGTVLSLPVGWGLMRRKEWARWGAIILAVIGIFVLYPILIIIYLLREEVREEFGPGL